MTASGRRWSPGGSVDLARRGAWLLLVAGAVLAPAAWHWAAGRTLVWFDTLMLYAPERWLVDEALRDLRLPLWNPHAGAGMPFLADAIHGVLHPVSVLVAWLQTGRATDALIAGHLAFAGLGAALLARGLGASPAGAAAAALAYGLSGFVLSMAGNLVFLAGAGSLPLCLAGLRGAGASARPSSLAGAASATALLALSGDAQALLVGGALGLLLAWEAGGWRGAARAVAAGALGLLVAGAQLVPSMVHLGRTTRADGAWVRTPLVWALEAWRLPELVLPGLLWGPDPFLDPVFGALAGPGHWPAGTLPVPFATSVFLGLLPVTLAVAGARQGRRGAVLAGAAMLLLWAALGPALGADAVLGRIPIWRAFRYAEKLVAALGLVLAVLAGLGLDAAVERRVSGRALLATAGALAAAALASCLVSAAALPAEVAGEAAHRIARGGWHLAAALAALGGWLVLRGRLAPSWAGAILAALAWGGVVAASPAALRPGQPEARLGAPGPRLEAAPPGPRIATPYAHPPLATGPGGDWSDQAGREYAALGYAALNVRHRYDAMAFNAAMAPARLAAATEAFGGHWSRAARRYGVTHVVLEAPVDGDQAALHALATAGGVLVPGASRHGEVWAVPHRPWASFPRQVVTVAGEGEARSRLMQGGDEVVVEAPAPLRGGAGRVLAVERGLESLRVEAEAPQEATLVVSDAWWPGWEASIDGQPTAVHPADALVRAVRWPAGRHVLTMRYRPPEVVAGLAASALGLLGLLALAVAGWRGGQRTGSGGGAAGP